MGMLPTRFYSIGHLNFELGTLHFEKMPNWVFMNFQLGILVKSTMMMLRAQIHKKLYLPNLFDNKTCLSAALDIVLFFNSTEVFTLLFG